MSRAHGTHAKYAIDHCRCDNCRQAQREYNRNRYRQLSRPDGHWQPYIDAEPARQHLAWLASCGVGLKTVAKLTGISNGALSKLVYGQASRPPSRRIRPVTAKKILAVMPNQAAGAQNIPAGPTWRLLDELITRGWSRAELARRLGHQGPGLQISRQRVHASTARAVEQLHAELAPIDIIPKKTRWGIRPTPAARLTPGRRPTRTVAARRFPLEPLAAAAGLSVNQFCLLHGLNRTRARAGLPDQQADDLALKLGFHPFEIWGEAWAS